MNKIIYLDNNATTYVDPIVADSVFSALLTLPGNSSSTHSLGRTAKQALMEARASLAKVCKVSEREIIFTSGGTEGMNLLIHGILEETPGHVITSDVEHACVFNTLKKYDDVTFLQVGGAGAVTPQALLQAIKPNTRLITLMAVNNETGVKTDIKAIGAIADQAGIPFVVDGVALFGKEDISIPKGVSAIAFSGHKFHAPKGVGFAVIRRGTKLKEYITGGNQEFNRRAGTENLPGIIGLAKAAQLVEEDLLNSIKRMRELRDYFEKELSQKLPISINGSAERICNTSNIAFHGIDGETLLTKLDRLGIAASHGSACSSGAMEPSRVLVNMGFDQKRVLSSIRFSLSKDTTKEEIDFCLDNLC